MSKKKKKAARPSAITAAPPSVRAQRHWPALPRKQIVAIGLMAVLALLVYSNTFHVPFQFDDMPNILNNTDVQFKTLSFDRLERLARNTYGTSIRIFAYITFGLNYYFGGLNLFGYHLVNLLIHIASGIFLYWLLLLTLNLPSLKERYGPSAFPIAFFSSLLFIAHPIQTQSVTYIVQRMASMAGMFYILALLLYVKGRLSQGGERLLYFAGMTVSYLLGLFSKENVAILPLFIALYEFYFFQNFDLGPRGKKTLTYLIGSVLFIGVLIFLFWGRRYIDVIIEGFQIREFSLTERVLTQFRVVLYYVTLLIYPHPSRLNLDYDFLTSRGIFDPPTTLLSILIVGGLIGYSLWTARKRPLVSYCILWYFGNLVIESSIFPLEMVYEHRLYLPAIGPFVLFAVLVVKAWERVKERLSLKAKGDTAGRHDSLPRGLKTDRAGGWRDYPLWGLILVVTVLVAWGSYERNTVWKDEITLWEDCLKKSPKKARVHNNLGFSLMRNKEIQKSLGEFIISIKLDPKYEEAYFNLGLAYGELKLFDKASTYFNQYLRLAPKDPQVYNEIGLISLQEKKIEEAIKYFKTGLEINPNLALIRANLGNAYFQSGKIDESLMEYQKAIELNPDLAEVYLKMAEIYERKGSIDLSMEALRKAQKIAPSLSELHAIRGAAYIQEGKLDEAILELNQALKSNPQDPKVYNNLGIAYREKKRLDEAIASYRKALSIDPSFLDARINLGEAYFGKGMESEAISQFQYAAQQDPDKAEVHNNLGVIFLRKKRLDEAISSFKKALAAQPEYGDACFNLALAYYYKKDLPSASIYAKKALALGYEADPRLLKALNIQK